MKANGRRDFILSFKLPDDSTTSSLEEVAERFVDFFQGLFGTAYPVEVAPRDWFADGPCVAAEDSTRLVEMVSFKEIKEALWSIGDLKAPGPDGYNSKFFKSTWSTTGPEVCAAVREIFR